MDRDGDTGHDLGGLAAIVIVAVVILLVAVFFVLVPLRALRRLWGL